MVIYFAHPVSDYNTDYEQECILAIEKFFYDGEKIPDVLDPNRDRHSEMYKKLGMKYFEMLARTCDICVGVPFKDGEFGMGVYTEMVASAEVGSEVYILHGGEIKKIDYKDISPLSINETRNRVKGDTIPDPEALTEEDIEYAESCWGYNSGLDDETVH